MSQETSKSKYTQGHSTYTLTTQAARTLESSASFLLPYIKPNSRILDIGCGPGTITQGLALSAPLGETIGLDNSPAVLQKAKSLAESFEEPIPNLSFVEGDVLKGLQFEDETFDIIWSSQFFGHLPPPSLPLQALKEIKRVLKKGGVIATRDSASQSFYPPTHNLDKLWVGNQTKAIYKGSPIPPEGTTGQQMPALITKSGFRDVNVSAGTTVWSGKEQLGKLAWRAKGQLSEGDEVYDSWRGVGISEEEIRQTIESVGKWAGEEGAWFVALHCDVLGWK